MITLEKLKALRGRHIMFTVVPPDGIFGKVANLTFVQVMGFEHSDDIAGYPVRRLMSRDVLTEDEVQKIAELTEVHERARRFGTTEAWENWVLALQGTARTYIHATVRWNGDVFEESGTIEAVESALFEMEPMLPVIAAQAAEPAERAVAKPRARAETIPMDLRPTYKLGTVEQFRETLVDKVFPQFPHDAPSLKETREVLERMLNAGQSLSPITVNEALQRVALADGYPDEKGHYSATLKRLYFERLNVQ